ncbi:MAG: AraC family transcriptional regulator [Pseudomonadota bacterium]
MEETPVSTALAVFHGAYGRAALYRLNRPLAPHAHREGHLLFLVKGAASRIIINGESHRIDPGQAVTINPWEPHEFRPGCVSEGSVLLTLYITPHWMRDMSSNGPWDLHFGDTTIPVDGELRRLVTFVSNLLADGHTRNGFAELLFELILAGFEKSWPASTTPGQRHSQRVSDFRIRNAIKLMNERVTDECVLDVIARDAGLSRPHFYKLFRQNIGLTPNMYLNTLRLERSIQRLTLSDDPVTAIGLDLGFASQASFTRFFSNNIGMSPTDYRRASVVAN